MKESIGATWIFVICLTFIIIFTAYIAISVNYAKAFKIKSHLVSQIEENDGYDGNLAQELETYLTSQGYVAYGECPPQIEINGHDTSWSLVDCIGNAPEGKCGACIYSMPVEKKTIDDINTPRKYYRATTFFTFDLPIVNVFIPAIRVSGESKYIYNSH